MFFFYIPLKLCISYTALSTLFFYIVSYMPIHAILLYTHARTKT